MARHGTKDYDEQVARTVLETALDATVALHDDGSQSSMYDLAITYRDGRSAAAEVVSTRNKADMMVSAAVSELGYTECAGLGRMWIVWFIEHTRLKKLAPKVPALLKGLEDAGIFKLRIGDRWRSPFKELGVSSAWSDSPTPTHPPGYYLCPEITGAWGGDVDDVVRECDAFLAKTPDVASKLAGSGLSERHAVVLVTVDWLGLVSAIEGGAIPTIALTLPPGVDYLWLIAYASNPMRAIYWLNGMWQSVTVQL